MKKMRRPIVVIAAVAALAALAVVVLPGLTHASAAPVSTLQVVTSGQEGVMAVHYVCSKNFEGCVNSTFHGCKGPC